MTIAQDSWPPPHGKAWEPTLLLEVVDRDISLATEIVRTFVEDVPEMSREVHLAVRSGSPEKLASAAHSYKGSALAIGALPVAEAAGDLETAARSGRNRVERELELFNENEKLLLEELQAAFGGA